LIAEVVNEVVKTQERSSDEKQASDFSESKKQRSRRGIWTAVLRKWRMYLSGF
jgi:hypothetical protein